MGNRRAGDHPWEARIRYGVGGLLGLGVAYSLFVDSGHSDFLLVVMVFAAGAMLKVNLSPILRLLPGGQRQQESSE